MKCREEDCPNRTEILRSDGYSEFSSVLSPWKSPGEIWETLSSSDKLRRATVWKTRRPHTTAFVLRRSSHMCQHSIPREYAALVLINQAGETDSLPACWFTITTVATTIAPSFCSYNRYQVLDPFVRYIFIPSYIHTGSARYILGLKEIE